MAQAKEKINNGFKLFVAAPYLFEYATKYFGGCSVIVTKSEHLTA